MINGNWSVKLNIINNSIIGTKINISIEMLVSDKNDQGIQIYSYHVLSFGFVIHEYSCFPNINAFIAILWLNPM